MGRYGKPVFPRSAHPVSDVDENETLVKIWGAMSLVAGERDGNRLTNHIAVGEPDGILHHAVGQVRHEALGEGVMLSKWSLNLGEYACFDLDTRSSIFYRVAINCPEAVAALLGKEVSDLPAPLQNTYFGDEPYNGNEILERTDPEDWALDNPWRKMNLNIHVSFSKSAVHARRKKLGLTRRVWPPLPKNRD